MLYSIHRLFVFESVMFLNSRKNLKVFLTLSPTGLLVFYLLQEFWRYKKKKIYLFWKQQDFWNRLNFHFTPISGGKLGPVLTGEISSWVRFSAGKIHACRLESIWYNIGTKSNRKSINNKRKTFNYSHGSLIHKLND